MKKMALILSAVLACACFAGCGQFDPRHENDGGRSVASSECTADKPTDNLVRASAGAVGSKRATSSRKASPVVASPDDYEKGRSSSGNANTSSSAQKTGSPDAYEDEAHAYPIDMMGSLDGVFIMRKSQDKLIELPEEMSHRTVYDIDGYTNPGGKGDLLGYVGSTYADPMVIDRKTEKLVLLGQEGGNRAPSEKDRIVVHNCDLMGYTAKYLMDDSSFDPEDLEDVSGAKVVTYDYGRLDRDSFLLAGKKGATCKYGCYRGTTFETSSEEMLNPVYLVFQNKTTKLDVVQTRDGYFEIDVSSLPAGLYVLNSYSGMYPFIVK